MKKSIIIALSILLVIGIAFGYFEYTRSYADTATLEAEYKLSASQLFSEFKENEQLATEKYKGKILEVDGQIASINYGVNETLNILLEAEGEIFGVACAIADVDEELSLTKGQKISVKGECSGILSDVILIRCVTK
jgi:hypothetical protein